MPSSPYSVGKCSCQFSINGNDVSGSVHSVQIYESICKPYITASAVFFDGNNTLNNMKLVGGESVSVTLNAGTTPYTQQLKILKVHSRQNPASLRSEVYVMELVGNEHMADRQNLVQQSFKNTTVSQAAQNIHQKYCGSNLNVPVPTTGMIGQNNSYIVGSRKPFTAIADLMRMASFSQYKTGNPLYFRDAKQCNLVPLEHLIQNFSSQGTFTQKATWGSSASDTFNATNAILAVQYGDEHDAHGTGGAIDVSRLASTVNQERKVWDLIAGTKAVNNPASPVSAGASLGTAIVSLLGSVFGGATGGHGGEHNYVIHDPTKMPLANARQTDSEKLYASQMKGGGTVTIMVPCQSGLSVTVGQGITANLLAPAGTSGSPQMDPRGGQLLVTDVVHNVNLSGTAAIMGTTTIRCIKGGLNS